MPGLLVGGRQAFPLPPWAANRRAVRLLGKAAPLRSPAEAKGSPADGLLPSWVTTPAGKARMTRSPPQGKDGCRQAVTGQRLADRIAEYRKESPIFIVGNARSGTTLMQLMLTAHPKIYICFEISFYNWARAARRAGSPEEFLEAFFTTGGFVLLGLHPQDILLKMPSPLRYEHLWLAFREMMVQKARAFGRVRYGDKTPGHTKHVGKILRDFPNARIIFMVRDPRSSVVSAARMPWGSSRDLANALAYEATRQQMDRYLGRVLLVRLEDLQADPRRVMRRVLDFVEEDWDEAVLDHTRHQPDPNLIPPLPWLESTGRPVQRQSTPWGGMTPARVRAIELICKKSMERYGYEPAELEREPSWPAVAAQLLSDVPESLRYLGAGARLFAYIRNPRHWSWEDEEMRRRFMAVNPSCWRYYPDFTWPSASSATTSMLAAHKA